MPSAPPPPFSAQTLDGIYDSLPPVPGGPKAVPDTIDRDLSAEVAGTMLHDLAEDPHGRTLAYTRFEMTRTLYTGIGAVSAFAFLSHVIIKRNKVKVGREPRIHDWMGGTGECVGCVKAQPTTPAQERIFFFFVEPNHTLSSLAPLPHPHPIPLAFDTPGCRAVAGGAGRA